MKKKIAEIRTFLEGTCQLMKEGECYNYCRLVLDRGTEFGSAKKAIGYPRVAEWCRAHSLQIKQCFYNSQMMALYLDEVRYFEGYCHTSFFAIHHAWNVMPDSNVVDVTLEAIDGNNRKAAYLGVEVPKDVLRKLIFKHKRSQPYAHFHYLGSKARFL